MGQTEPTPKEPTESASAARKRSYLKQSDVPEFSLAEALRIPTVVYEQFGADPTRPTDVALALGLLPTGRHFRQLSGSAVAYGLALGGAQADAIEMTDLATAIVAPTEEGAELRAMREAFLLPRVHRQFLEKYNTKPLPTDTHIGRNVLEQMGVPRDHTEETLEEIISTAMRLGLLTDLHGKHVVNLSPASLRVVPPADDVADDDAEKDDGHEALGSAAVPPAEIPEQQGSSVVPLPPPGPGRVFISHGSDRTIVAALKKMLEYGEFEPVVSVERESTAKPVPKKVFDDMRSCDAGVIHVAKERTIVDHEGNEHHLLNENVLTEIGGAMALWGENFILLVEEGTKLPSNLQGLYEVRYEGTTLDADATMKLLHAFKQFKSRRET